jgi:hypothetical protein
VYYGNRAKNSETKYILPWTLHWLSSSVCSVLHWYYTFLQHRMASGYCKFRVPSKRNQLFLNQNLPNSFMGDTINLGCEHLQKNGLKSEIASCMLIEHPSPLQHEQFRKTVSIVALKSNCCFSFWSSKLQRLTWKIIVNSNKTFHIEFHAGITFIW